MARSADDEYVAALFVVCVQGNHLPAPFVARAIRSLARGARPLGSRMLSRAERVKTSRGPTEAVAIEWERFEAVMLATAHGLLYALDGQHTTEELSIVGERGAFATRHAGVLKPYDAGSAFRPVLTELQARGEPVRGSNPEVLSYIASRNPVPLVRMVFYREIVIWAVKVPRPDVI